MAPVRKDSCQRNDLQRIGLFSEVGYVTIADPYIPVYSRPYNESASRGKQMMTSCTKSKTGLIDGYFQPKFGRIFEKESYSDPVKLRRQERIMQKKRNIDRTAFYPSSETKKPSGLGNHYGTFGGSVPHFKAVVRAKTPYKSPGRNFLTNPTKKGSGYGYTSLTIAENHEYMTEFIGRADEIRSGEKQEHKKKMVSSDFRLNMHPKEYFDINPFKSDRALPPLKERKEPGKPVGKPLRHVPFKQSSPGKAIGNCKAGTFTPYPEHPVDGFGVKSKKAAGAKYGIFKPSAGSKSRPTDSVLKTNINKVINKDNFRSSAQTACVY